jgi:glutamyl-tRNA synthetase
MTVKTRFAPSPTGKLHVGNARIALINWLFSKSQGGSFMLRLDDTDTERSKEEYAQAIKRDLLWLGLEWDELNKQSLRTIRYQKAFETLKNAGRLYPCYETPEELELKRKIQLSQSKPPLYDRAALKLTEQEKQDFEAQGIKPHWRLLLNHTPIQWDDIGRGAVSFQGEHLSDPVLFRGDGTPVYTLASVVDDDDLGITHVIRGEDHVVNTASQVQLCEALGGIVPTYGHISLLTGAQGEGLSKRDGSLSLESLRDKGIDPMAINALLAKLGSSEAIEPRATLQELITEFDIAKFSRATPKFDPADLDAMNLKVLHVTPFEVIEPKIKALGLNGVTEEFWNFIRPNLNTLEDIELWWAVCYGEIPEIGEYYDDQEFLKAATSQLPFPPWNAETWHEWTEDVKKVTGRKGKALYLPLRQAITAMDSGPEMAVLLPMMGYELVQKRLGGS